MKTYVTQIAKQIMVTAEQSPQVKGSLAQQDGHGYVVSTIWHHASQETCSIIGHARMNMSVNHSGRNPIFGPTTWRCATINDSWILMGYLHGETYILATWQRKHEFGTPNSVTRKKDLKRESCLVPGAPSSWRSLSISSSHSLCLLEKLKPLGVKDPPQMAYPFRKILPAVTTGKESLLTNQHAMGFGRSQPRNIMTI